MPHTYNNDNNNNNILLIFLLRDFSMQRIRKKNPLVKKPTTENLAAANESENMGNGCTKNVRRLNKNTVAPKHPAKFEAKFINNHVTSTPKASTNPFECDENESSNENNTPSTSVTLRQPSTRTHLSTRKLSNRSIATENPSKYKIENAKEINLAAQIDTNSIIFDKSETVCSKAPKPFVRSVSVDSASDKSVQIDSKRFSTTINRFFRSKQNSASTPNINGTENNLKLTKLYNRLSGSVQTLFQGNLSSVKKRNFSASDTNLSVNRKLNGNCRLSHQQLIDNDYCPSVLYNRKARRSSNERGADKSQIARWKDQLWMKFSRKKSDPRARKA